MIRKFPLLILIFLTFSCSDDSVEPKEPDNQTDDEIVVEEEESMPEEEEEQENDGDSAIPFDISVVLKKYQLDGTYDGEYYVVDFFSDQSVDSQLQNLTETFGIQLSDRLLDTGTREVLNFVRGTQLDDMTFIAVDLNTSRKQSLYYEDIFSSDFSCVFPTNNISWNPTTVFTYQYDNCLNVLQPLIKNLDSGEILKPQVIENASIANSWDKIWGNENYLFVQFNSYNAEDNSNDVLQDGIIVYDAITLEVKYINREPLQKTILVDNDKMVILNFRGTIDLIDLSSGEAIYSNQVELTEGYRANNVAETSVRNGLIGLVLGSNDRLIPAYLDANTNQIVRVNIDKYYEVFYPNASNSDFFIPEEFKIEMESKTFAVTFTIREQGAQQPKSSGIIFMDFDGNVLYQYEFPPVPFLPEKIIRR